MTEAKFQLVRPKCYACGYPIDGELRLCPECGTKKLVIILPTAKQMTKQRIQSSLFFATYMFLGLVSLTMLLIANEFIIRNLVPHKLFSILTLPLLLLALWTFASSLRHSPVNLFRSWSIASSPVLGIFSSGIVYYSIFTSQSEPRVIGIDDWLLLLYQAAAATAFFLSNEAAYAITYFLGNPSRIRSGRTSRRITRYTLSIWIPLVLTTGYLALGLFIFVVGLLATCCTLHWFGIRNEAKLLLSSNEFS